MTITAAQLREWADVYDAGEVQPGVQKPNRAEAYRLLADAMEEVERLKARVWWFESAGGAAMAERIWQEMSLRKNAEIKRGRLKVHADAMADAIQFGDLAILTVAKAAADAYRADQALK